MTFTNVVLTIFYHLRNGQKIVRTTFVQGPPGCDQALTKTLGLNYLVISGFCYLRKNTNEYKRCRGPKNLLYFLEGFVTSDLFRPITEVPLY